MNTNVHFTEEELQLAERYLSGNMTAGEKKDFEQLLATNAAWNEKWNAIQLLLTGVQEAALRNEMQQWNQPKKETPVKKITWLKKLAVAASIILVVSVAGWLLFLKPSASEKLFAGFYKQDPGLATKMSVSASYEFERAMVDYKTGNYTAALERWNKLSAANGGNDTLYYFIASAQLGNKETAAAIASFDKVTANKNSVFYGDACWYKGLALVRLGKQQEAIPYIQQSGHPQKAALLLKLNN